MENYFCFFLGGREGFNIQQLPRRPSERTVGRWVRTCILLALAFVGTTLRAYIIHGKEASTIGIHNYRSVFHGTSFQHPGQDLVELAELHAS